MDTVLTNLKDITPSEPNGAELDINACGDEAIAFMRLAAEELEYAFQPIVDIINGTIYGYEALLRRHELMGFDSIHSVFDKAHELGILHRFDMMLRKMAISKFTQLPKTSKTKLLFNLDSRILNSDDFFKGGTRRMLQQYDLPLSTLCIEISERHEVEMKLAEQNLAHYKQEEYLTAIDDFGAGYSGLKLLKEHEPDLIKVDRTFIRNIAQDKKARLLLSTITGLAHVLGIFVVAEGVETEMEMKTCKEVGCDLVQGYFISRPHMDIKSFKTHYGDIVSDGRRKMPNMDNDSEIIIEKIEYRPPLRIDDSMETVFEAFRRNKEITFFPVVNEAGSPMGIINEKTIKEYTYSPFGKDLIANKGTGINIRRFLSSCPVADIQSSAQMILENYSLSNNAEGIIIVRDFGYLGFLSASSLLQVINQKNIAMARDSSPLTKLPGNSSISEFVNKALTQRDDACTLAYFDLDNFKAFNDAYGFRQGDRAIMLFADLMRKNFQKENVFLGHIGGDDFFIGVWNKDFDSIQAMVSELLMHFKRDVVSFYDRDARENGYLIGKDRQGEITQFPLMSCSAAVVHLHAHRPADHPNHYELDSTIARLKKKAKMAATHLAIEEY